MKKRKLEVESELELAQATYEEAKVEAIDLQQRNKELDKIIEDLKEKIAAEKRDAEKRQKLLSLLGPNSKENQEKVTFHRRRKLVIYYPL